MKKAFVLVALMLVAVQVASCASKDSRHTKIEVEKRGIPISKFGQGAVSRDPQNPTQIVIDVTLNDEFSKNMTTVARGQAMERGMSAADAITNIGSIRKARFIGKEQKKRLMVIKADFFDSQDRHIPSDQGPSFVFDGEDYQRIIDELKKI